MESATEHQGRILLVDDESAILRTFRYCLEDEGYSVATANSAAQAEALLQRQVFDLCFLDLRLGEDNGLDVLAQMRIQAPWMRVVIVTAHSAVDTAVDAIQAGAADYLVKPITREALQAALDRASSATQIEQRDPILIVDDNSNDRAFLAELLEYAGYEIVQVDGGHDPDEAAR